MNDKFISTLGKLKGYTAGLKATNNAQIVPYLETIIKEFEECLGSIVSGLGCPPGGDSMHVPNELTITPVVDESFRTMIRCANELCPASASLFNPKDMVRRAGKLYCTRKCSSNTYTREWHRRNGKKLSVMPSKSIGIVKPEKPHYTTNFNLPNKPMATIEYSICANPKCTKRFGKFVKGTGTTERGLTFCNYNCSQDYFNDPNSTGYSLPSHNK